MAYEWLFMSHCWTWAIDLLTCHHMIAATRTHASAPSRKTNSNLFDFITPLVSDTPHSASVLHIDRGERKLMNRSKGRATLVLGRTTHHNYNEVTVYYIIIQLHLRTTPVGYLPHTFTLSIFGCFLNLRGSTRAY